jgi:hypothetical protein
MLAREDRVAYSGPGISQYKRVFERFTVAVLGMAITRDRLAQRA